MSSYSVLTNSQAASAVLNLSKTLTSVNQTQERMNTGLRVSSAKDDASTFTIAMGMRSDVGGFKAIRENLSLGKATVGVASSAAESIGDLISKIKAKVTQAGSENVSRSAIQGDIDQYLEQIRSIIRSANFNGVNLIDGNAEHKGKSMGVLASLDRANSEQDLTLARIDVPYMDLGVSPTGGLQKLNGLNVTGGAMSAGIDTARVNASRIAGVDTAKQVNTSTYSTVSFTFDRTNAANGMQFNFQVDGTNRTVTIPNAAGQPNDTAFAKSFNDAATAAGYGVELVSTGANAYRLQSKAGGPDANVTTQTAFLDLNADGDAGDANEVLDAATTPGFKSGGEVAGFTQIDLGDKPVFKQNDTLAFSINGGADVTYTFDGTETAGNLLSKLTNWASANGHDVSFSYLPGTNTLKIGANRADQFVNASGAGRGFNIDSAPGSSKINYGTSEPTLAEGDTISIELNGVQKTYTVGANDAGPLSGALTKIKNHLGIEMTVSGGVLTASGLADTDTVAKLRTNIASVQDGAPDFDQLLKHVDGAEVVLKDAVATLGSASMRLDTQDEFVSNLIKNLDDGIGTLVDANMAEESARFQALQVQQQLGIQALSIANAAPQAILSLFKG